MPPKPKGPSEEFPAPPPQRAVVPNVLYNLWRSIAASDQHFAAIRKMIGKQTAPAPTKKSKEREALEKWIRAR